MDEDKRRYAAFLSYSHRDAAAARALHRRLESYRIPRRLVGSDGARGPVPARLTPIFRDREELPAAGDLSETVRAALAVSDALVILCSPAAAASPWVAKEIETFRALHPDRPVIAAILEGEPSECFPRALCAGGIEPLAADLRPGRDGRRLGFLKLVAGLSGVGLDSLVQRDAQRRLRRVTAVTGVALLAVVAMAVLTIVALQARREAQRQRAEAEGLVEFMLTDLRNKLRGVGRLDIMQAVNERALRRYQGSSEGTHFSDDALSRRAQILRAIGEDEIALGDLGSARSALLEARSLTKTILQRNPSRTRTALQHAESGYWLGRIYELRRDWTRAGRFYRDYAAAAEDLLARDPDNPDFLAAAASAEVDLGNLQLNGARNFEAAQHAYERAIALFGRLSALRPADPAGRRNQANAYAWLADTFFMRSRWHDALEARRSQYALTRQLRRDYPGEFDVMHRFALADLGLGATMLKAGHSWEGRAHLMEGFELAEQLKHRDPNNAEWRSTGARLACTILFAAPAVDPGTASRLRATIRAAYSQLTASQDPRASELARCVRAIDHPARQH